MRFVMIMIDKNTCSCYILEIVTYIKIANSCGSFSILRNTVVSSKHFDFLHFHVQFNVYYCVRHIRACIHFVDIYLCGGGGTLPSIFERGGRGAKRKSREARQIKRGNQTSLCLHIYRGRLLYPF